jgi:hypothetical protein
VRIRPAAGRVCYLLAVANVDGTVAAAHIHQAPAGVNGPVVVPLTAPVAGPVSACATVDRALARNIARNPANFYVNVHSTTFPAGAVRGQLARLR